MPEKENPDPLELIRAKAARVIGSQMTLLTIVKGLPLAYNKDLQETQEPLFDAAYTVSLSLEIAAGFMRQVIFDFHRMGVACEKGFMNSMAAATYLARHGVPFRLAPEAVAAAGQTWIRENLRLQD